MLQKIIDQCCNFKVKNFQRGDDSSFFDKYKSLFSAIEGNDRIIQMQIFSSLINCFLNLIMTLSKISQGKCCFALSWFHNTHTFDAVSSICNDLSKVFNIAYAIAKFEYYSVTMFIVPT